MAGPEVSKTGRRRGLGLWKGGTTTLAPATQTSGEGAAFLEGEHHDPVYRRLKVLHALGLNRRRLPLWGIVAAATCFDFAFGLPIHRPRIFGDELIYWDLS